MDSDRIAGWIEQMEKETTEIRQEALKMAWYMRGGITYEQALALSADERKIIGGIIKDNMDTTKKTGLPFF
jgi:hypothetical protein